MIRKILLLVAMVLAATRAGAEVARVEIAKRGEIGSSGYEKIIGTIHFVVDPKDPHNKVVVDLDKVDRAATNESGRVEFSADLYILRPKDAARSNGVALVDVVNRGRKRTLDAFNRGGSAIDLATDADLGDHFLMRQGFTLVWVGWQFDVPRQGGLMRLDAPAAAGISGIVRATFTPDEGASDVTVTDLAGYAPSDPNLPDTALTVRDGPFGHAEPVARERWRLRGNVVSMSGGFEPGRTYELAYRAANPAIAGLGFVALRDVTSWVKYQRDAAANVQYAYAFGSSQSGRFLRNFLYEGFNTDEHGRQVFDAVMAHIAGAARISLNHRWATPNSLSMFTATTFPFSDRAERDPVSGKTDGLLDNDRARKNQPKVFYTNSSVEYWGGGRAAALLHTTPDGASDIAPPDNVRAYFLAGTQHSPGRFPPKVTRGQQRDNPVDYWWTLRALLVAMDRWVKQGTPPPPSQYPRLADGTLVPADRIAFVSIPGVASPRGLPGGRQGWKALPLLVPQVDEDGNERAGVRLPDVAVPLATYTGWNFRNSSIGGTDQLVSLLGSSVPFAKTSAEREAAGDPRRSVEARYTSLEGYLALVREAAGRLVTTGYLLADDVPHVVGRAEEQWTSSYPQSQP